MRLTSLTFSIAGTEEEETLQVLAATWAEASAGIQHIEDETIVVWAQVAFLAGLIIRPAERPSRFNMFHAWQPPLVIATCTS